MIKHSLLSPLVTLIVCFQCQKIVITKLMPYCTLLLNFLQGKFIIIMVFPKVENVGMRHNCIFYLGFSNRYGENHPMFYIGTLEAASQEAFYGKARDVSKLLPEKILNSV